MLMSISVFDLAAPDMLGRSINWELHTLGSGVERGDMVCEYIMASTDWLVSWAMRIGVVSRLNIPF